MNKQVTYGEIRVLPKDVMDTRTVQFEISNANKDRHKTVLNMDNWVLDHFNANPIIGYQHNVYGDNLCTPPNPDDVMGPGRAWLQDGPNGRVLMGEVTFETADINPLADKIFKKILNKTLRATSVGFMEIGKSNTVENKDAEGKIIDRTTYLGGQELLEFSIVNIPSNRQALQRSINNHKEAALAYIVRMLPSYSINDVQKLTVREILDAIEKQFTGTTALSPAGGGEGVDLSSLEDIEKEITRSREQLVKALHARVTINEQLLKI